MTFLGKFIYSVGTRHSHHASLMTMREQKLPQSVPISPILPYMALTYCHRVGHCLKYIGFVSRSSCLILFKRIENPFETLSSYAGKPEFVW